MQDTVDNDVSYNLFCVKHFLKMIKMRRNNARFSLNIKHLTSNFQFPNLYISISKDNLSSFFSTTIHNNYLISISV